MAKTVNNPVEVKAPNPSKWNTGIRLALITLSIGFVLGFLSHIGYVHIDNYINRSVISVKIKSLNISRNSNQEWTFLVAIDQKNTGNTDASYNIEYCTVLLPMLQKSPIRIMVDKGFNLKQNGSSQDTLSIQLPFNIKCNDLNAFDSLSFINLSIKESDNPEKYLSQRNYENIAFIAGGSLQIGTGWTDASTLSPSNTGTGIITYHKKQHQIFFRPKKAKIEYAIVKDDMINVRCNNLSPSEKFEFFVDADLKDHIILPTMMTEKGNFEDSTADGKVYHNYQIKYNTESNLSTIYYSFKD